MTLSQQLSQFITSLSFSDIPPQVIERAKYHLLDTLGVALAGSSNKAQHNAVRSRLFT